MPLTAIGDIVNTLKGLDKSNLSEIQRASSGLAKYPQAVRQAAAAAANLEGAAASAAVNVTALTVAENSGISFASKMSTALTGLGVVLKGLAVTLLTNPLTYLAVAAGGAIIYANNMAHAYEKAASSAEEVIQDRKQHPHDLSTAYCHSRTAAGMGASNGIKE